MMPPILERDAVISECGTFRYLLRRVWHYSLPRALIVALNPSTADAEVDDATIRALYRLLDALGFGSFEVVNLFAFRATDPRELAKVTDPVGLLNDAVVRTAIGRCDVVICAWGANAAVGDRAIDVLNEIHSRRPAVYCFGKTKSGAPKHPLYIKTGTRLETYS